MEAVLGLAKRNKQLASVKTQAAARLHAVLAALIPGGLGKENGASPGGCAAALGPVAPIDASPGAKQRHRLNQPSAKPARNPSLGARGP